jgi:hypothetical protein
MCEWIVQQTPATRNDKLPQRPVRKTGSDINRTRNGSSAINPQPAIATIDDNESRKPLLHGSRFQTGGAAKAGVDPFSTTREPLLRMSCESFGVLEVITACLLRLFEISRFHCHEKRR